MTRTMFAIEKDGYYLEAIKGKPKYVHIDNALLLTRSTAQEIKNNVFRLLPGVKIVEIEVTETRQVRI